MKNLKHPVLLSALVLFVGWAGYIISETTQSYSGPQATGVLTFKGLVVEDVTMTGTTTNSGDATFSSNLTANVLISDELDAETATTLLLGKATATKVEIADAGVTTDVEGPLVAKEDIQSNEIDSEDAGALLIGKATATSIEIGDAGVTLNVQGKLDSDEGQGWAFVLKTANYTNLATDVVVSYTTSAATTNTVLEASTVLGQIFVIALFSDGGDLIVKTDGTDKFDGAGNDILTFADAGDSCWVQATAADAYTILVNVGGTLSN